MRLYYSLAPGYYEVYTPVSWKHEERYFVKVDNNGKVERVTKEEVIAWLKTTQSAASEKVS
jgi:hypothetical protein